MKIALLGSGSESLAVARSLIKFGHTITHIGPVTKKKKSDLVDIEKLLNYPKKVVNHKELMKFGVTDILLISYAPIIESQFLKKARFLNIHYALLPRFRGMHGLYWSIINDEKKVGYTLHMVDNEIDHGPVFHQKSIKISDNDTINEIRNKIEKMVEKDVGKIILQIENGKKPTKQNHKNATFVSKRYEKDSLVNWNWSSRLIFNYIRALCPPYTSGAFTFWKGKKIILLKATFLKSKFYISTVGKIVSFQAKSAIVKCCDTVIQIDLVSFERKIYKPKDLFKIGDKFE